jgi:hypothetical protein
MKFQNFKKVFITIFFVCACYFVGYRVAEYFVTNKYEQSIIKSFKYNNEAVLRNEHGYVGESILLLEEAIRLNPSESTFYYNLSQFYSINFDYLMEVDKVDKPTIFKRIILLSEMAVTNSPNSFIYRKDLAINYALGYRFDVEIDDIILLFLWENALEHALEPHEQVYVKFRLLEIYKKNDDKENILKILNDFVNNYNNQIDDVYLKPYRIYLNSKMI